jgi:hypothetical protein
MDESPFRDNHVYHVVDAADFPMSLIPRIYRELDVAELRPKNRRSSSTQFRHSKKLASLHFIITRADLLAPQREQVDSMMTEMREVLRNSLGSMGDKVRLGNVHMVSSILGWWTPVLKEKIWEHGGAVWFVGKANVGKSSLLQCVIPKSMGRPKKGRPTPADLKYASAGVFETPDPDALLPPPQRYADYPVVPIVSHAPGTTALPIRIPFGGDRGEVIDLPGLERSGLDAFVKDEHRLDLQLRKRPKPERLTMKPGQSLLLDGLIRITSLDPDLIILAAPFVKLHPHLTSTEKSLAMEDGSRAYPFDTFAKEDTRTKLASAGVFELKWDVTRLYTPKHQGGRSPSEHYVPLYQMLAIDILIEGTGWVELLCSVRTRNRAPGDFPKVEVFSPEGKFVSSRKSLGCWRFVLERINLSKKKMKANSRR